MNSDSPFSFSSNADLQNKSSFRRGRRKSEPDWHMHAPRARFPDLKIYHHAKIDIFREKNTRFKMDRDFWAQC
jgi:hypothetical protein